jgi:type I restriction enzyme S subunit
MGELFDYDFISSQEMKRVELNLKEIEKYLVKDGDLLFARRSLVLEGSGKCSLVINPSENTTFESSIIRARLNKEEAYPKFYYYLFRSPFGRALMASIASQTAVSGITGSNLLQLKILKPPISIQHKISAILSAYDRLIENNTRRIKILEEMARSLYDEWFVKFRFPGYEQTKMVDSELGLIPEGWELKKLGDVVELVYGRALKAEQRLGGLVAVYGSSGVVGYHNEYLVKAPGIIVGRKGNVGSVFWSEDDFFPIDTVFYVQTEVCLHYVYYNLKNQNFINNDAAVPGLNRNQAYSLPFILPSQEVLERFQNFISPLFSQLKSLRSKNTNL